MSVIPSESTLSTYTATDGDNIAMQDWPLPDGLALRGVVIIVHGLGEHAGRYDTLAKRLNTWGFAVRGYDQYGHGESGGARGTLPTPTRLLDDLGDIIDSTRMRMGRGVPLLLFGHSMGGVVVSRFVSQGKRQVDGLVLSSPALDPGLSPFKKLLLGVLSPIAPNLPVANGLDADFLSHDPDVVDAYRKDPRVHKRVSPRLVQFILDAGAAVIAAAPQWKVPTLLMYAGQDHLTSPGGSRAFAAAAPTRIVTTKCFGPMFHEIFNEADPEPVYELLKQWLDVLFAAPARRVQPL